VNDPIQPPPLTGWVAPAAQPEPIDWAHREMVLGWRRLAAQGHEGAMRVVQHYGLTPLPAVKSAAAAAPVKSVAPSTDITPPAAPRATSALSAPLRARVDLLTNLISPPTLPPGTLD
jgi:hypothetical protein